MTSTSVKDVRSLFLNQAVPSSGKAASGGEFHKVWSSQMNRGTGAETSSGYSAKPGETDSRNTGNAAGESAVQKAESVKAGEKKPAEGETAEAPKKTEGADGKEAQEQLPGTEASQAEGTEQVSQAAEDGTQEAGDSLKPQLTGRTEADRTQELLLAMEVLGAAALNMMEQIANAFGIDVEELQAVMDSLGMGQADLMDPSLLGGLLLKLGGAEDVYALVTDGELYDNYQAIMKQLDQVLQESAEKLETEPETLPGMFRECMEVLEPESMPEQDIGGRLGNPEEQPVQGQEAGSLSQGVSADGVQEEQGAPKQEPDTRGESGRQAESRTDREAPVNHFMQEIKVQQPQPQLQQAGEITGNSPWSADTRQIMEQIMDYMKLNLSADATSLEMQLHPASLGTLQVQIASKGGIVTASFVTENEAVKAALESQMIQLREQFEEQGVKVEAIEVTVQTHEFEQNLEQGRGRSQQETERKGRSRRISLGGVSAMAETEAEAPEAEGRAADVLMDGGSTVSYTA